MSLIEVMTTPDEGVSLWDKGDNSVIELTWDKWKSLVDYIAAHPNESGADEVSIYEVEDGTRMVMPMAQWRTIVKYVEIHPLDLHGWVNHVREDGTVTGKHGCPCHNIVMED